MISRGVKKIRKTRFSDMIFNIVMVTVFCLLMFICLYPFYYVFIYSISDPRLAMAGLTFLPRGPTLGNFREVFQLPNLFNSVIVSVSRTVLGTIITVICCSFFGFLVTKSQMYFRRTIYRMVIITMYFNSGLIPWFLTMQMYGLGNNFLLYIVPSAISAFYVILFKTFMEQIPASMEESAKLDGAGIFTIFTRIIFPLSKPIVATITVFAAVLQWNSWFDNFALVTRPDLRVMQMVLRDALNQASALAMQINRLGGGASLAADVEITPMTIRMTMTMVVTFPIIFVYPFMQRYFVKGIMLGAIKG